MTVANIIAFLESVAPPSLQESYDNAGLITGHPTWECRGVLCTLDATEEVIREAMEKGCNLVVSHHPIIFSGLKRINGHNYVERAIITAIRNDIAIYAIHTNLDNVLDGVSGKMASMLGLEKVSTLQPRGGMLKKLFTFVPAAKAAVVRDALFEAGAGQIGHYSECSFNAVGTGTFRAGPGADPYVGEIGKRHEEDEIKIEVIFPAYLEARLVSAMKAAHPYEEVAYDVVALANPHPGVGAGAIGELPVAMDERSFLELLKSSFGLTVIRHTPWTGRPVKRVALCGGAGSFLISNALSANADVYISSDIRYHEFFDADGRMLIADIGHYESEQFTIPLLQEILEKKFLTFAILKTEVKTNPVQYFK